MDPNVATIIPYIPYIPYISHHPIYHPYIPHHPTYPTSSHISSHINIPYLPYIPTLPHGSKCDHHHPPRHCYPPKIVQELQTTMELLTHITNTMSCTDTSTYPQIIVSRWDVSFISFFAHQTAFLMWAKKYWAGKPFVNC